MPSSSSGVDLTFTRLAESAGGDGLFVVGPSLGTAVAALWGRCASILGNRFEVVGWDLPGHGRSAPATASFSIEDLAGAVRTKTAELAAGRPAYYAGVSLGGAVGFALALDPGAFLGVAAFASAPRIGQPDSWRERAELVRSSGIAVMVEGSAQRWFAPGFATRHPVVSEALLDSLASADGPSYALACEALADFDLRDRVAESRVPILIAPGELDGVVPPSEVAGVAAAIPGAVFEVVAGAAHQPSAEDPLTVAALLTNFANRVQTNRVQTDRVPADRSPDRGSSTVSQDAADPYHAGMVVRREVLGDAHVDRAEAAKSPLTTDFQAFITRYAWGSVWTRPGLDRRMRSAVTLTALVAHGHWDELRMHVIAARRNGLSVEEIGEILMQCGVYCGVPAANHAFSIAKAALAENEEPIT